MKLWACNPDGFTIVGLLILVGFIGVMGGLLSKDKDQRKSALVASTAIVLGSSVFLYITNC